MAGMKTRFHSLDEIATLYGSRIREFDNLRRRFESRVAPPNENGCRLWIGARKRFGYGALSMLHRERITAHRLAWLLDGGTILPGMLICHTCDVTSCVEISHLFVGTVADNSADCQRKGRAVNPQIGKRGELCPHSVLTAVEVAEIRSSFAIGVTGTALAKRFGVSKSTVSAIKLGTSWNTDAFDAEGKK